MENLQQVELTLGRQVVWSEREGASVSHNAMQERRGREEQSGVFGY